MAIHLAYMQSKVNNTGYELLKEIRHTGRKIEGTVLSHVVALTKESIIVAGVKEEVNRLFVEAKDSGDYKGVGWILSHHVNHCMICNSPFTALRTRHHCHACGNVVCSKCSPNKAPIVELIHLGPQTVCVQCYYGQDEVYATQSLRKDMIPQTAQERHEEEKAMKADVSTPTDEELAQIIAKKEARRKVFLAAANERKRQEAELERELEGTQVEIASSEPSIFNLKMGPGSPNAAEVEALDSAESSEHSVTPVPGFVMKTKRSNGEKVFVNVCSHTCIKTLKDVYLGEMKRDKDHNGNVVDVYDAVISEKAMRAALEDEGLKVRQDMGLNILTKIEEERHENLGAKTFTTPLTKNHYKGNVVSSFRVDGSGAPVAVVVASAAPVSRRGFMRRDAPSENVMRPFDPKKKNDHGLLSMFE